MHLFFQKGNLKTCYYWLFGNALLEWQVRTFHFLSDLNFLMDPWFVIANIWIGCCCWSEYSRVPCPRKCSFPGFGLQFESCWLLRKRAWGGLKSLLSTEGFRRFKVDSTATAKAARSIRPKGRPAKAFGLKCTFLLGKNFSYERCKK